MTAVMVLGDIPTAGIIRQAGAVRVRVDSSLSSDAALEFVSYAAHGLQERRAVVALYPAWRSAMGSRFVQFARGMLDTDRIAGVPINLPPLAFSLVADQLSYVAQHVSPGLLASLAHRLPRDILAGAWVNSVARLEHIETGLGKHVTSYLPGTGFMVSADPYPAVHRITTAQPVGPISHRPEDPVLMLASHEEGNPEWVRDTFHRAISGTSLTFVGAQPLSTAFWGTKKYVEFVAFSGHSYALQNAIRAMPCRPCAWCREPTALEICPFCAMVQPVPQPMDQSQGPPPQPSSAPPQPVVGPQQPGSAAPPARPQAGPAPARPVPHPPRPPAPQPRQPAYGWYEQTRAPTGVPPPEAPPSTAPASQPRPPAGGESRSSAGERVHTVTFAVPDFRTDNGTNGSTSLSDPPPTSNGASSPN
ncbi:MAG TPA: hypothetical protein VGP70_25465 [Actinomadura sp.]|nr:hypothetical protein [Actinomadura sp.]